MNPTRIYTLLGASIISTTALVGTLDHWAAVAPFLRNAGIGAWIVFAVATATDRILDAITKLRHDVDTYGDQRHSDGYVDGHSRQAPAQPTLQRIQ